MPREDQSTIEMALMALGGQLEALGSAGLLEAISAIDLPDHLWLAIQVMCLPDCQRDSIVQALLRFHPLGVMELADGSVLLRQPSQLRFDDEAAVKASPKQDPPVDTFVRPPFRPAPARRKALRLGR